MNRKLNVYLNFKKVGILEEQNGKNLLFHYFDHVKTPISLSMPISSKTYAKAIVAPFFENLLPEGDIIKTITQIYHVSEKNAFSLLNVIGEDCAGSISLSNNDLNLKTFPLPKHLDETELSTLLSTYNKGVPYYKKGMRLSLAGAQNKTTLIYQSNDYYIPSFKYPSTHIIKFINVNVPNILYNEHFCTSLAEALKLTVSKMSLKMLKGYPYLLIERFDRQKDLDGIKRINQEDFCQILSIPPSKKYQKEGGPKFVQIYETIKHYSSYPLDLIHLAKILIFNFLIGNCDYHAKNLSMLHKPNSMYQLTPFYDLLSTYIYEEFDRDMAMSINKKYAIDEITKNDFEKEIDSWGLSGKNVLKSVLSDFKNIISCAQVLSKNDVYQTSQIEIQKIIDLLIHNYHKIAS